MKKLAFLALILPLSISWPTGLVQAATQEKILQNPEKYPELEEYKQIFFANLRDQNILDWSEKCQKIIGEYLLFIVKNPRSEFIDDAKLRIAEFYELSYQKEKALPYLNDIIKNHPDADYFSVIKGAQPNTKTAAWALYWRGLWFMRPESVNDWERILTEYPESKEAVGLAKAALAKFKPKK
ncbi:MAG: hypothetical protein Q8N42_01910 [bacterium]|nr:hypothetical protein [bacterium]